MYLRFKSSNIKFSSCDEAVFLQKVYYLTFFTPWIGLYISLGLLRYLNWYPHISLALYGFRPPFLAILFSSACAFPLYQSIISDFFFFLKHSALPLSASPRAKDLSSYSVRKMKWSDENFQTSTTTLSTFKPLPPKLRWTTHDVIQCQTFSSCLFKNDFSNSLFPLSHIMVSLSTRYFPLASKTAVIFPSLKKKK